VDEHFYQNLGGIWLTSSHLAGPWDLVEERLVPESALARYSPPKDSVTARLPSGLEATYEPPLKAYKIAGRKGLFLYDGRFYHFDGIWLDAKNADGPWTAASAKVLPGPLRRVVPAPEAGQHVTLPSGETLTYDADARVYRVDGKTDTVLFDGTFYEHRGGKWLAAPSAAAGFDDVAFSKVPGPVRALYGDKKKGRKQGKNGAGRKANAGERKEKTAARSANAGERRRGGSAGDDEDAKPARHRKQAHEGSPHSTVNDDHE